MIVRVDDFLLNDRRFVEVILVDVLHLVDLIVVFVVGLVNLELRGPRVVLQSLNTRTCRVNTQSSGFSRRSTTGHLESFPTGPSRLPFECCYLSGQENTPTVLDDQAGEEQSNLYWYSPD